MTPTRELLLKALAEGNVDIALLDSALTERDMKEVSHYNMPGLNGIETLCELKRQHPRMEVVTMTPAQDEALAALAREAGAAGFLKKPLYPSDIDTILYAFHRLRPPAS